MFEWWNDFLNDKQTFLDAVLFVIPFLIVFIVIALMILIFRHTDIDSIEKKVKKLDKEIQQLKNGGDANASS